MADQEESREEADAEETVGGLAESLGASPWGALCEATLWVRLWVYKLPSTGSGETARPVHRPQIKGQLGCLTLVIPVRARWRQENS